jgi:hypothetical protein
MLGVLKAQTVAELAQSATPITTSCLLRIAPRLPETTENSALNPTALSPFASQAG